MMPDDPAIAEIRALLGLSVPDDSVGSGELDANLSGSEEGGES